MKKEKLDLSVGVQNKNFYESAAKNKNKSLLLLRNKT